MLPRYPTDTVGEFASRAIRSESGGPGARQEGESGASGARAEFANSIRPFSLSLR